jgi:signal transduction histidine kinase
MLTVVHWSVFAFKQMQEKMEEARDQQLHLREVEVDLLHANRELARLSKYLKAVNQVAEEALQAKENFVASVSHELRTPLNMILGFSEVIAQSPEVYGARLPPTSRYIRLCIKSGT